jgi:hypothetical protein
LVLGIEIHSNTCRFGPIDKTQSPQGPTPTSNPPAKTTSEPNSRHQPSNPAAEGLDCLVQPSNEEGLSQLLQQLAASSLSQNNNNYEPKEGAEFEK